MVHFKGKDEIAIGHYPYTEANYGDTPGAVTLYRIGFMQEVAPQYDPELTRQWVLQDVAIHAPITLQRKKENVRLRLTWLQGELTDYWQKEILEDHENFFMELKIKRDAEDYYILWTGIKVDTLRVRSSIGEMVTWIAECIGKSMDTALTTTRTYGARPGEPYEWDDTYIQISDDDIAYATLTGLTDWEFIIKNNLHPNFVFNAAGSKQLSTLEEMEQDVTVNLTITFEDTDYLEYLLDQDELYLKVFVGGGKWLKAMKGKFSLVDPIIKPEDLIACRCTFEGRWLTHNFT